MVLFLRDFRQFTGGHLKTWHYFEHTRAHPRFDPFAQFTEQSAWGATNPWSGCPERVVPQRDRFPADVLFLGGLHWLMLPERQRADSPIPVINIIQHVRHTEEPRRDLLRHRAVRVCVSPEVAAAVAATGLCNGPLVTIPNAIDLASLPAPLHDESRADDVLIAGKKAPALARTLAARLSRPGRRLRVLDAFVPQADFLGSIRQARVTVFLPNPTEGFFLPALEGMALRSFVVCPDVVGNRSFCADQVNCLVPAFSEDAIIDATEAALAEEGAGRARILAAGSATAARHDLAGERAAFHQVLDRLDELYRDG